MKQMHAFDSKVLYKCDAEVDSSITVWNASLEANANFLEEGVELGLNGSGIGTNNLILLLTVFEEHESRHSTDRVFLSNILRKHRKKKDGIVCQSRRHTRVVVSGFPVYIQKMLLTAASSTSTLAKTISGNFSASLTNLGPMTLQGPHHWAWKSTATYTNEKKKKKRTCISHIVAGRNKSIEDIETNYSRACLRWWVAWIPQGFWFLGPLWII